MEKTRLEYVRENIYEYMEKLDIPKHMREGIVDYVIHGIPAGGFLSALFSNDLVETFSRADGSNKENIPNYVTLLYNYLPASCWGSEENYKEWIKNKGLS